jgi:hypothetical protein
MSNILTIPILTAMNYQYEQQPQLHVQHRGLHICLRAE